VAAEAGPPDMRMATGEVGRVKEARPSETLKPRRMCNKKHEAQRGPDASQTLAGSTLHFAHRRRC
jgi:hypothetical protein